MSDAMYIHPKSFYRSSIYLNFHTKNLQFIKELKPNSMFYVVRMDADLREQHVKRYLIIHGEQIGLVIHYGHDTWTKVEDDA